jgi:hypothetical protein
MTALALAALEVAQGILGALAYGLDHIHRDLSRKQRRQQQARRLRDSVHRDLERLG